MVWHRVYRDSWCISTDFTCTTNKDITSVNMLQNRANNMIHGYKQTSVVRPMGPKQQVIICGFNRYFSIEYVGLIGIYLGGQADGAEAAGHPGLDDTRLHAAHGHCADTADLVHVLGDGMMGWGDGVMG
jgi:hypothetical protein